MDAHWVNDRPGYRCRHGRTSAKPSATGQPKTVYRREVRANRLTIVCDDVSCTLSSDQAPDTRATPGQQTLW